MPVCLVLNSCLVFLRQTHRAILPYDYFGFVLENLTRQNNTKAKTTHKKPPNGMVAGKLTGEYLVCDRVRAQDKQGLDSLIEGIPCS